MGRERSWRNKNFTKLRKILWHKTRMLKMLRIRNFLVAVTTLSLYMWPHENVLMSTAAAIAHPHPFSSLQNPAPLAHIVPFIFLFSRTCRHTVFLFLFNLFNFRMHHENIMLNRTNQQNRERERQRDTYGRYLLSNSNFIAKKFV